AGEGRGGTVTACAKEFDELLGESRCAHTGDGRIDVVLNTHELYSTPALAHVEKYITGPPVTILWPTCAAGIYKVDAIHNPVPWPVRVPKGEYVAGSQCHTRRHLPAEVVHP